MSTYTATYSPDDNKLRLYSLCKLDPDTYATVKTAGFSWAPKQGLFVAPMWTPSREDLLLALCGEIDDEDTSLTDRAEERSERFEGYSERRGVEAEHAHAAVKAITDNIPMGQPILIGHHSERHARKDAERIENGMRRAVRLWDTARYWEQRAAGAIRHAKYKERPDVRARRIKGIEADRRKQVKTKERSEALFKVWTRSDITTTLKRKDGEPVTLRVAVVHWANLDGGYYSASYTRPSGYTGPISLWEAAGGNIDHAEQESRAIATPEEICRRAAENHRETIAMAARWITHYDRRLAYEKAMLAADGGTVADKTGPEKGGACKCWASPRGGWSYIQKVNKVSVTVLDNWGNGGANFTRTIPFDKLAHVMSRAEVDAHRAAGELIEGADRTGGVGFFLRAGTEIKSPQGDTITVPVPKNDQMDDDMRAMKDTLRAGVQVITAPQLFPTPPAIAARMIELAEIEAGQGRLDVLEPSAGTGSLIGSMLNPELHITAVEKVQVLADTLQNKYPAVDVRCADFLACNGDLGTFDRIVMNPPFERGDDIRHIEHALTMLRPGGRLVALCANGPRQREAFQARADYWEDLPAGSFKQQGTGVNVALCVFNLTERRG